MSLDRLANIATLISFALTVLVLLVALLDGPARTAASTALATMGVVVFVVWARRPSALPGSELRNTDLDAWRGAVRDLMYARWASSSSPLWAIADRRRSQSLVVDGTTLHARYRDAAVLSDGTTISLAGADSAGELYDALEASYLVVGDPGAGKSVLLWQTLEYLLERTDQVPLLVELTHWNSFDSQESPALPRFEDFVVKRLQEPALATPTDVAQVLAREAILLLDGLDELYALSPKKAVRMLDSIARSLGSGYILGKIVITTRPGEYAEIVEVRGSGTSAVRNSVRLSNYSVDTVVDSVAKRDPPPRQLVSDISTYPAVARMLLRPLWLSIALEVYQDSGESSPFAGMESVSPDQAERLLSRRWITDRFEQLPPFRGTQTGFLASRMVEQGASTLFIEDIQRAWLPPVARRISSVVFFATTFGAAFVLIGASYSWVLGLIIGAVVGPWGADGRDDILQPAAGQTLSLRRLLSWRRLRRSMLFAFLGGSVFWLAYDYKAAVGIFAYLFIAGFSISLDEAFVFRLPTVVERSSAEMIRRDLWYRILQQSSYGVFVGSLAGLVVGFLVDSSDGLLLAGSLAFLGVLLGTISGFRNSVLASHLAARTVCTVFRLLPVRLRRYLDRLVEVGLLYRVGSGYRFRHRLVGEWIAEDWRT